MARPPTYTSDAEKPVSISLRIPRDVYDQAQHHAHMRRTTLTALIVEGLRLRLETPLDPRDILVSQDNTVMQELQEMIDARIHAALAAQRDKAPRVENAPTQPLPAMSHDSNAVLQKQAKPTSVPRVKKPSQDFDRDKFHLGTLCNRKHEYGSTGKSLRRNHKNPNQQHCLECVRENNRVYVKNKARAKEQASS
jgi:hypothetical protein